MDEDVRQMCLYDMSYKKSPTKNFFLRRISNSVLGYFKKNLWIWNRKIVFWLVHVHAIILTIMYYIVHKWMSQSISLMKIFQIFQVSDYRLHAASGILG
jgi:hypothetical protein